MITWHLPIFIFVVGYLLVRIVKSYRAAVSIEIIFTGFWLLLLLFVVVLYGGVVWW